MFQQFLQRIGVRADEVPANEFELAFREESRRIAGATMEDPARCDTEALEELVYYWNNPLRNLCARELVLNYERPRAWVELLRREVLGS